MGITIEVDKQAQKRVNEVADLMGLKAKDIITRAILLYLDNIEKYVTLKKEFKSWDNLSDKALLDFEKQL